MLDNFLYIVWDFDPVMFSIGGFELRYYGLMWAITFLLGERFFSSYAKREGFGNEIVETGFVWIVLGAVLGARIGHCLFYEFPYYITKPWAIITEFRNGGMASHGSALGMLLGMWVTCRKHNMPYVWWLDRIMIPVAIGGALVRFGNLCNSEIVGHVTDMPWGFKFLRLYPNLPVEMVPAQHPAQVYEAICYIITFVILLWLYYKLDMGRKRPGLMFSIGLIGIFLTRPFIELVKENQEAFEEGMAINMGQLLSIPFILLAIYMFWGSIKGRFPVATPTKKNTVQSNKVKNNGSRSK
ncbi:MAG: prolipoprotein diacylglyceryl transferase [Alistipes sp.]|nr:prolipoprotein diacylglyceryl transferase [Alistipes sp.]